MMKSIHVAALCLLALAHASHAAEAEDPAASAPAAPAPAPAPAGDKADFCFYTGKPSTDLKFTTIQPLRVRKETYGSVADLLPELAGDARRAGGDAVIDYDGAQRFGFFPWRLVRPVVHGTVIKWNGGAPDCAASGGTTLATIVSTRQAPARK